MTNIFDTHAHYSSRQFDADRDAVMRALGEGGVVGVLECATHSGDAAAVLELAHKYPFAHAALGITPKALARTPPPLWPLTTGTGGPSLPPCAPCLMTPL